MSRYRRTAKASFGQIGSVGEWGACPPPSPPLRFLELCGGVVPGGGDGERSRRMKVARREFPGGLLSVMLSVAAGRSRVRRLRMCRLRARIK